MWQRYVIRDFHPLLFFYAMAFSLLIASVLLGLRVFYKWLVLGSDIPPINALAWMFSLIRWPAIAVLRDVVLYGV